jgi:predicted nucleic-acid-binding protein
MVGPVIGLDTNVLVRILVADDPRQTAVASRLLERADSEGARLFVPQIVLVETAWVLRARYRLGRDEVARALETLLDTAPVEVEGADRVTRALRAFRAGRADLSDYLAREAARSAGAQVLATFDEVAQSEDGFVQPDPTAWPPDVDLCDAAPTYRRSRRRVAGRTEA